jgi:hypothetical protein
LFIMDVDAGEPIKLMLGGNHTYLMWWELKDVSEPDSAHIAVGVLAEGGWYVQHTRHGCRRFASKQAAWTAVRRLMGQQPLGRWEQVPGEADKATATHRGPHHPLIVAKAAAIGYRAAYTGRPPGPLNEQSCCSEYGFLAGTRAGERDRHRLRPGTPYAELPTETGEWHGSKHPGFHDPSHVIKGVIAGYLAGRSGQPPELLKGQDCCFAFGFHESVRLGEDDYFRAKAEEVHMARPGVRVEDAERELRSVAFRRKSAQDGWG